MRRLWYISCLVICVAAAVGVWGSRRALAATGTIRVCVLIGDQVGNIVRGEAQPGVTFGVSWYAPTEFNVNERVCFDPDYKGTLDATYPLCPASRVLPTTTYRTPLVLNTRLPGFPNGPGNGNNAQCTTFNSIPLNQYFQAIDDSITNAGTYFYRKESISGGSWEEPLYNDTFTAIASINNLFEYDNSAWFDGDPDTYFDVDQRNSEGAMLPTLKCIKGTTKELCLPNPWDRTLIVFNQYRGGATPTPTRVRTPTPTPRPVRQRPHQHYDLHVPRLQSPRIPRSQPRHQLPVPRLFKVLHI